MVEIQEENAETPNNATFRNGSTSPTSDIPPPTNPQLNNPIVTFYYSQFNLTQTFSRSL